MSTYREHGHALARGVPAGALMAELFGKATGCSGGRGGSMHVFDASRRFYGGFAIVGRRPAGRRRARARRPAAAAARVTACFFGEGAAAEGEFHESLNLAALWRLPVLFLCENNRYAMGTALERSESQTDICRQARSYAIPARAVDGMDVVAVGAAVRGAVEAVRRRRRARASSSSAPTGSARTRCTTRSSTASKAEVDAGASATRSSRSSAACGPLGRSTTPPRGDRVGGGGGARRGRRRRRGRAAGAGRGSRSPRLRRGGPPCA